MELMEFQVLNWCVDNSTEEMQIWTPLLMISMKRNETKLNPD